MRKNKKILLGILILGLLLVSIIFSLVNKIKEKGSDFKIGILADDGVALVSISKQRKMINILKIDPEVQIWIPGGLGWYRNIAVKKILQQENKVGLMSDVLFYNFGFSPDKIISLKKVNDWKGKFWWQFILNGNQNLTKEEILKKDIDQSDDFLDEVMIRDFSETKIVNEDLKLSVVNLTNENGLATFMTKRFERLGFSVISIGNNNGGEIKTCQILYGLKVKETFSWKLIDRLIDCSKKEDLSLNQNEVELYFDDNFSTMIKYPSYKK
ncbi:MAG: hypothetical protein WC895_00410 [Candidatus Shapirobacteria bacterium]|jgi:hypothetical protein